MSDQTKIYVAGHRGMVGSAIVRQLQAMDCHVANAPRNDNTNTVIASEARQSMHPAPLDCHVADAPRNDGCLIITRTHAELDLTNQAAVQEALRVLQPPIRRQPRH